MPKPKNLALLIFLALSCGCAEQTAYNSAQRGAQVECAKEPTQELYERCIKAYSMPYREYKTQQGRP